MQRLGEASMSSAAAAADRPRGRGAELPRVSARRRTSSDCRSKRSTKWLARRTEITRVPKTPKFLEGVINLRGDVLPVVDQRRRFDMPQLEQAEAGRRLIVVRTGRHRAGLIVDSVSEVLRTTADAIEGAPDLTEDIARLVHGVVNLEAEARIVLLLDPAELLTRAERGLLDKFESSAQASS